MPINIYDPRVMDQVVQVLPATGGFFRDTFFKRRLPVLGNKIDVDFYKGKRRISPFVNPKSAAKTVEKTGYKTNTFTTPLLKPKDITTVESISVRMPGEGVYGGLSTEERALMMLTNTLQEFNDMNMRREEWMASRAMLTGKIPVIGEGVNYEIDFGFTNKEILVGVNLWSAGTSNPLADIDRWVLACQQNGYHTPNVSLMSYDAYNAFMIQVKAQGFLDQLSTNLNVLQLNPRQLTENVVYGGMILKYNMPIYIYNEWFIDDWTNPEVPVESPIVPAATVLLGSTNAKTTIYYGEITLTDENTASGFRSIVGERAAQTWVENDPPQRFLALHSRPLPVPQEVDSWYVGTVL
ncbi:major capsid protein [Desulfosporosinus fructosivorans]|uniref:Major capsid protein n=1 Tax=Desulfosporosinus fructosivorans TaxID=2018669 RepID=A0A4Z0R1I7_9FIRM|nr:major capsid protein [Desulfosporosinus fructosivorans]TGE36881.1 major capsid protein [Desulfosporosinus fructosivorans]